MKVKTIKKIGIQKVAQIEVKTINKNNPLNNSYLLSTGICSHNCNGPHVPLVVVDEIDTVSGEGIRAYAEISGMLDSKGDKIGLRVGISTRKSRFGLMNKAIDNAEQEGRTVRRWTALEFTERCSDDRSGVDETELYTCQENMETITPEVWSKKDQSKQKDYLLYKFPGSKCTSCPIAPICLGDAKNQKSNSPMLKPIDELIKKTIENGPDWALSQLMNLKPSIEGVIYKEFEEKQHVKSWNEMWKILTGKDFPGQCTHDLFVKKCHELKMPCYAGIDWGWSAPSTIVFFFVDKHENIYVVRCEGRTYTNNTTWVQIIKNKWHNMYRCQLYFPDMSNPGDAVPFRDEGLSVNNEPKKDNINDGIQIIKRWLKSLASPLPKMFFANETCRPIIEEFSKFHFKLDAAGEVTDDPDTEYDHWLDALRYPMVGLFSGKKFINGSDVDYDKQKILDSHGNFLRNPTPAEFASARGIDFNSEISQSELDKLGKQGTLSELESDNEDELMGGSGAFIWSM